MTVGASVALLSPYEQLKNGSCILIFVAPSVDRRRVSFNPHPQRANETNRVDDVLFDNAVCYGRKLDAGSESVNIGALTAHLPFGPEGKD